MEVIYSNQSNRLLSDFKLELVDLIDFRGDEKSYALILLNTVNIKKSLCKSNTKDIYKIYLMDSFMFLVTYQLITEYKNVGELEGIITIDKEVCKRIYKSYDAALKFIKGDFENEN